MIRGKKFKLFLIAYCISFSQLAAQSAITGTVVNSQGQALDSAKVWLKANPEGFVYTDDEGNYSLSLETSDINPNTKSRLHPISAKVTANVLLLNLLNEDNINISLFNSNGQKEASVFNGPLNQGSHNFNLQAPAKALTPGMYFLKIQGDFIKLNSKIHLQNSKWFLASSSDFFPSERAATAKQAMAEDTLVILRMGYEIKKLFLENLEPQEIPQQSLSLRSYAVDKTADISGRTIEIVLPSDYQELYTLPVLYLMHGGGEDHATWRIKANYIQALNTFEDRDKMQPMIIVTPDAATNSGYGDYGVGGDPYYQILTEDIIGYMEENYKVDSTRWGRAVSGFSMGAMQTHNLTMFYPEVWGYSLPMCGGLYRSAGFSEQQFRADIQRGVIDTAAINQLKLYKLSSNETDIAYTDTFDFEAFLTSVGIKHVYDFTSYNGGGHTYEYNTGVLKLYLIELFKP